MMERYTQTSNSRCTSGRSVLLDMDDALEHLSNPVNRMHVTVKRSSTAIPEMAPNRMFGQFRITSPFSVKTYPAAIGLTSRRVTNYKTKLLSANSHPLPGLHRSKTVLSTPCRHCDACSIKHLRHFNKLQSSTGILMENGPANSMKRSKSDLQLHDDRTRLMSSGLRTGERNTVFIMGSQEAHTEGVGANKEEVMLPTATVPKKGLIKLTSLDEEHADPKMFSGKKQEAKSRRKWEQKANVLIKRKDIRDQMQEGMRVLEEEEQRKNKAEEEANIEDYTLGDLQTALDLSKDDSKNQDKGQSRQQKAPKLPQVIESIKQQTFQLPVLAKKK